MVPPPLVKMDKELVHQLQEEEVAVEEVQLGSNTATLEVVMKVTGLLTCSQLGSLGTLSKQVVVPSQVAGLS